MKLGIINGSHRTQSQSLKIAQYIQQTVDKGIFDESWIFSLAGNPLPLWDESVWEGAEDWQQRLDPIKEQLNSCDAFVIIAPEWHGQVPAGLKNFFLLFSKIELGHKPAMIVAVSSGDGGATPVAELRMSSYKNNRICYIPEQMVVRNVESVLNENAADNNPEADSYFRERFEWSLKILRSYAAALKTVRESGLTVNDKFSNGM